MNKKTIPTALIGAAAAVSLLAGCSGADDPTPKNASSMSQAYEQGASAAEAAKRAAESQLKNPAANFDPLVATGEKFQYTQNSTAVIDQVAKVSDPAPGCVGEFYAVTLTITNTNSGEKAAPNQARVIPVGLPSQKQEGGPAQQNALPVYCEQAPWPRALVMPDESSTGTIYGQSPSVSDPVALRIESGTSVYVEIPEDLR